MPSPRFVVLVLLVTAISSVRSIGTAAEAPPAASVVPPAVSALAERMNSHVQQLTADVHSYRRRVARECRNLPEGDLFPLTFPLIMAANHRLAGASEPLLAPAVAEALLDAALAAGARITGAKQGDLRNLTDYRQHATYLGHCALALRAWRYVAESDNRLDVEQHLVDLLARAMIEQQREHGGAQLRSFPALTWTFDTIPCAVAILSGASSIPLAQRRAAVEAHLRWVDALIAQQQASGQAPLPPAQVAEDGSILTPPRGCELSWRIALLASIDRPRATALWRSYREHYADDAGGRFGFREWPRGSARGADVDSGPIIDGLGGTATVFGIAASLALNDYGSAERLVIQIPLAEFAVHSGVTFNGLNLRQEIATFAPYDRQSISGFLFGDIVLAYAATWQDWRPLLVTE